MKKAIRLLALLLALIMTLSGCEQIITQYLEYRWGGSDDILQALDYYHPDLQVFEDELDKCRQFIDNKEGIDKILECVDEIYWQYSDFYTNENLAYIHYCYDMTNTHWQGEYEFCADAAGDVEAYLEELYMILAESSYREELERSEYFYVGFFDQYTGEAVWNETYVSLYEQEQELLKKYYQLSSGSDISLEEQFREENSYGQEMVQVLVDLIKVRQQMAQYYGYDSYADMAYQVVYYRDYTASDAKTYLTSVAQHLSDLYARLYDEPIWDYGYESCTEQQTYTFVQKTAKAMGGSIEEAFDLMKNYKLYDISFGLHKYDGSFCTYLDTYGVPFIFINPWQANMDKLSFAHEFGHFVNDYICEGSYAGMDVAEVQSQAMEYMALCCTNEPELEQYKLADSLDVYVLQSAYALFELEAYELQDEDLTAENLIGIFERVCEEFGITGYSETDFVSIGHFYTDPMYVISYVVSNDLAMQIYELEKNTAGAGIEVYLKCVESEESALMTFANTYGLKSPFETDRINQVRELFEKNLAA